MIEGPLIFLAVICSTSAFFAVAACSAVAVWRADTEDVSCVMMVEFWAKRCPCCVRIAIRAGSMVEVVLVEGVTEGTWGVVVCFDEEDLQGGGDGGGRLFGVGEEIFSFSALIFRAAARLLEIRF